MHNSWRGSWTEQHADLGHDCRHAHWSKTLGNAAKSNAKEERKKKELWTVFFPSSPRGTTPHLISQCALRQSRQLLRTAINSSLIKIGTPLCQISIEDRALTLQVYLMFRQHRFHGPDKKNRRPAFESRSKLSAKFTHSLRVIFKDFSGLLLGTLFFHTLSLQVSLLGLLKHLIGSPVSAQELVGLLVWQGDWTEQNKTSEVTKVLTLRAEVRI